MEVGNALSPAMAELLQQEKSLDARLRFRRTHRQNRSRRTGQRLLLCAAAQDFSGINPGRPVSHQSGSISCLSDFSQSFTLPLLGGGV